MRNFYRYLSLFVLAALLVACAPVLAQGGVPPVGTPTEDCDCSLEDILATPTGGISMPGPVGPPAGESVPSEIEAYIGQWETYTDVDRGFSFEYPAVYESPDYVFCAVRESEIPPDESLFALNLGSRTSLTARDAGGQDLVSVVEAFRNDPARQEYQFEEPIERTVGGSPAVVLPYRSGGTNRFAEVVFFINEGMLYQIDTGVPSACDVTAIDLQELEVYSHMLDTFLFAQ